MKVYKSYSCQTCKKSVKSIKKNMRTILEQKAWIENFVNPFLQEHKGHKLLKK